MHQDTIGKCYTPQPHLFYGQVNGAYRRNGWISGRTRRQCSV